MNICDSNWDDFPLFQKFAIIPDNYDIAYIKPNSVDINYLDSRYVYENKSIY